MAHISDLLLYINIHNRSLNNMKEVYQILDTCQNKYHSICSDITMNFQCHSNGITQSIVVCTCECHSDEQNRYFNRLSLWLWFKYQILVEYLESQSLTAKYLLQSTDMNVWATNKETDKHKVCYLPCK